MSKHVRVAVFGASGYMGEELVRLLLRHPYVDLVAITSRQYAGQSIGEVFPRYREAALKFTEPDVDTIAPLCDVAFLALPHVHAAEYGVALAAKGVPVIDVSADFRLDDPAVYEQYYAHVHPAPELLATSVYGLPEINRKRIRESAIVGVPGCYPTSILLAAMPLLRAGLATPEGIVIASCSGASGAGRKADLSLLFAECNESIRPYKVTDHRHLSEIEQELAKAASLDPGGLKVNFIPHLIPVNRGIHTTIVLQAAPNATPDRVAKAYADAYDGEPCVRVLAHGEFADTKHVTFTNICEIGYAVDARTGRIVTSSAIDNLTKGGSGQAVQCLNIRQGYPETTGLI